MRRNVRFVLALLAGLALVAWAVSLLVQRTTRRWFEHDLSLRAQLAVSGGRQSLIVQWNAPEALGAFLTELTRDERILAAAACDTDQSFRARTADFPEQLRCGELSVHLATDPRGMWSAVEALPGGPVHVSAVPLLDGATPLGFVVLVHDLSYVTGREASTRQFLFLAFGFVAIAAPVVVLVAARLSWRGWSRELRRLLRGDPGPRPEFQPILRDVRDLVERIVREKEADSEGGLWTPQRLKQTLRRHLEGEKVVILANREPYIHQRAADGSVTIVHPASGLVSALEPVMRACSGTWIAHGSGSADRDAADAAGRVRVPPGEESYVIRRVWLSPEEERGYYYGFSNEGLWPLCHIAHARPVFRAEDWSHYQRVNQRFVDALCDEVDTEDPIVLVQDYHFALAPRLIRQRLPRATIIMFWHIPWPNSERFGICPWREKLLEGMLGSSIIGFHTHAHCNNFVEAVDRFLEARIDRDQEAVVQQGRATLIRPYPISIEWPNRWASTAPAVDDCRRSVFAELGLPADGELGVGVDRLDYTKGVEERLLAVELLLEGHPDHIGRFTFVQLAAPSRTGIEAYRALNDTVERTANRINERFGRGAYQPIVLLRAHHEPPTVFRYYRAANLCYVSSLHDGMNLVAKEFVAARDDERGVLILSQFTGAARELTEALIVNPYDLDEAAAALATALAMSPDEQADRMRAMRAFISEFNVYRWAGRMLVDAARLRRRDRLAGRLSERAALGEES
ncbi:MAG: trehalose-6-phosphate synthase [Gemmatimonadota bacterium]